MLVSFLWSDALCIKQNDVAERQSQVRLMGAVYGNAKYVLCWLVPFNDQDGDSESRARLAIRFLRGFNNSSDGYLQAARHHLHSGEEMEENSSHHSVSFSQAAIETTWTRRPENDENNSGPVLQHGF